MSEERLKILRFSSADGGSTFADDVRRGLTSEPKFLLPKYFYDALGSHLFEAICHLPEYYPTRAELEILRAENRAVIELTAPQRLIELGSGSSRKTHLLIEAILSRQSSLHYLPIDISPSALERSAKELLQVFPGLSITGICADYLTALDELARQPSDEPTLVIFLGSSIGNLDPAESRSLLRHIRGLLRGGDCFLLGADLKKSPEVLIPAYDDPLGVTAAFNLNLLVRINRELGGEFQLDRFRHRTVYDEKEGRIELYIVSREAQAVPIRGLDLIVELGGGELIHTENSYKYDLGQLESLAQATGFELTAGWFDGERRFSVSLLRAGASG
jgi:dimethylhistidine N-methyltransferase